MAGGCTLHWPARAGHPERWLASASKAESFASGALRGIRFSVGTLCGNPKATSCLFFVCLKVDTFVFGVFYFRGTERKTRNMRARAKDTC